MKFITSIASGHYPRMIFRDGERMLWNPLTKKTARFRPEERVRLQFIDYLMLQTDIPASRISVESPVPSRYSRGRTDILCYDSRFKPHLLVECKAEYIIPGPKAATQAATYNRFIKAPYIMLTNGVQEALYDVSDTLDPLSSDKYPLEMRNNSPFFDSSVDYWKTRGFIAQNIPAFIASPFAMRLALLFQASGDTRSYLNIAYPTDQMPLSHYYVLLHAPAHPDTLIAVTLRADDDHHMTLCAVSNRKKRNTGCLRVRISELGEFHNPELFLVSSSEVLTPEVSDLESSWNNLDHLVHADPESAIKFSNITKNALHFSESLSSALESIFFTTHHD